MKKYILCISLVLLPAALMASFSLPPTGQDTRTLIINGQPSEVSVIQINGRYYADLEALSHAVNAALTFKGNQILLTSASHAES